MPKALLAAALLTLAVSRAVFAAPSLTIYNQNFAVVRDKVALDLKAGVNRVQFPDATAFLEPDSVVLRDPSGKVVLNILEQKYRSDAASMGQMLKRFEGQTIDFQIARGDTTQIVRGKIIRAGSTTGGYNDGINGYLTPLIEVDGKLQFQLPGTPLFPALDNDILLKPTLEWLLGADKPARLDAEISYFSQRMTWDADYNLIAPENGDNLALTGWVTLSNTSGKTFNDATIKLMAGNVNKIAPNSLQAAQSVYARGGFAMGQLENSAQVTQKTFDEYHLYSLPYPTTLRDGETKQVEMVRSSAVNSKSIYVYDGAKLDPSRYNGYSPGPRMERDYGTNSSPKVWVMREFENSKANGLGVPLPTGRIRFYRQNSDGQIEFTGENNLDHTPQGETVRAYTGDSFDIVGARRRTNFKTEGNTADESFEIKLRNRKSEPVEIRVVEHLYRWTNWDVTEKSNAFVKSDAQVIEFRIQVKPNEEKTVTYTVHYSW